MPYHCMGHRCNSCGAVHSFDMSAEHRVAFNLSVQQCGCCNVQYNPCQEMCQGRTLVTCPNCQDGNWDRNYLLSSYIVTRLDDGSVFHMDQSLNEIYVRPGNRAFIGPIFVPPQPCRCQACDR